MKKIIITILITILCIPIFNVAAENTSTETNDQNDMVSLPVQILDFNRDNLFFEYNTDSGLDFNNGQRLEGQKGWDGNDMLYAPGLVIDDRLADGQLIYKKEEVERIANLVGKELLARDYPDNMIFTKLKSKVAPSYIYSNTFGNNENNNYFYDNGWLIDNQNILKDNGNYYIKGNRKDLWKWQKNSEDFISFANNTTSISTKVEGLTPNQSYNVYLYAYNPNSNDNQNITVSVYDGNTGNCIGDFENTNTGQINVTPISSTVIVKLKSTDITKEGKIHALCWNEPNNNLFTNSSYNWIVEADAISEEDNVYYSGNDDQIIWEQNGDGIVSYTNQYALYRDFDVVSNSTMKFDYWDDCGSDTFPGSINVSVFSGEKQLGEFKTSKNNYDSMSIDIPDGISSVRVILKGNENEKARIAALKITSGDKYKLGDYDETVQRASQFNTLDDLLNYDNLTCMDYTYFMLTHLFKETNGLNVNDNYYRYMVLQKNSQGIYAFDSNESIVYDKDNKVFYNDYRNVSGQNGVNLNGFFPLEGKTDGPFNEKTKTQYSQGEQFERNYHFTLKSSGQFVYSEEQNQYFDFTGDDDVYLFINGRLAIDLGGAHLAANAKVELNDHAKEFGLEDGKEYSFSFFYMERHTDASNLKLNTNIQVYPEIQDPLQQRITFEFVDLDKVPTVLYVQLYRTSGGVRKKYNVPIKFSCGSDGKWSSNELSILRKLEREGTDKYEIECISDLGDYRVQYAGEIVSATDESGVVKEYRYILSDPNKAAPVLDGAITIKLDDDSQENGHVYRLYDADGNVINENEITHQGDKISELSLDTYNVKVFNKDGHDISDKVEMSYNGIVSLTKNDNEKTVIISYKTESGNDDKKDLNEENLNNENKNIRVTPVEENKNNANSKDTKTSTNEIVIKTGDGTDITIYVLAGLLSVSVLCALFIMKLRKKNR